MVIFVWGAKVFFDMHVGRPPTRMEVYVVGKQWMWKLQHPEGEREINELHVPRRPAGEADHDLRGRDPQLLRPGVPRQAGRAAGPLHDACWFEATKPGELSPVLRRVLRHRALGDDRQGRS